MEAGDGRRLAKRVRREAGDAPRSRVTELEEEWEGILEKENNLLLNRLLKENRMLERTFQQFQTKMESILLCSKECLESSQDVRLDNRIRGSQDSDAMQQITNQEYSLPDATIILAAKDPSVSRENLPIISLSPSIIYHAAAIASRGLDADQDITPNDLCESIMAWKMRSGQRWDFRFLLTHFQWNEISALLEKDMIARLLHAPNFYSLLLDSVLNGTELDESAIEECPLPGQRPNSATMTHQRRSVSFCAYVLVQQYRPFMTSQLTSVATFWLLLNFLIFLTFPTEENLRKIPSWLWPTKEQLLQSHPGVLDFIIWPEMRSALVEKWELYQLPELLADLTYNLEFHGGPPGFDQALIRTTRDGAHLEIDPALEKLIFDRSNHRIRLPICQKYPELAQYVGLCNEPITRA
ncbi:hypothetical protein IQ07DRAFT_114544 [Pyrenochaeta sp. DS3sAY3a]|nr:hypothetical protein IQ07DRAFT_114544 [Pyrenochaeta sp. DS3sAY3a]